MKSKSKNKFSLWTSFSFVVFLFLTLESCIKIEREPKVETGTVTDITTYSARAEGNLIDIGDGINQHGHCWSTSPNPDISGSNTSLGHKTNTGSFTSNLQNLQPGTQYYIKAYAQSEGGVFYGNELSFTTTAVVLATLTTTPVSAVTQTSALSGGNITSDGGAEVTARGVCWSTSQNPTISDSRTTNGSGTGTFTSSITGLSPNTTYYVRAYATNSIGTAYGNEIPFTTNPIVIPTLITTAASSITTASAISGGNITSAGGGTITARGVCWSTSQNPTIANNKTSDGSGTGSFVSNLTGLTANTTYYVLAYATNSAGTAYGNQISFTTDPLTITDMDGNTYNVIRIGTQLWMKENLKTTKYKDGTNIPLVTEASIWVNLTTPAYCWYNNNEFTFKETYGALYNGYTVNTSKLCPIGWHVPNWETDIVTLVDFLGGSVLAAGKLKESGTSHWLSPNTGATNESGFTALPGGSRGSDYADIGNSGVWWLSSPDGYFFQLLSYNNYFCHGNLGSAKGPGFSIRCIKD
jgi:uncharacterized protein (TIGR02145 family)